MEQDSLGRSHETDAVRLETIVTELSNCVAQLEMNGREKEEASITVRRLLELLRIETARLRARERIREGMIRQFLAFAERWSVLEETIGTQAVNPMTNRSEDSALVVRYQQLVDRKYLGELTDAEAEEMRRLADELDAADEPYYASALVDLREMARAKSDPDA